MRKFALAALTAVTVAMTPLKASANTIVENFTIEIGGSTLEGDFDGTFFAPFNPSLGTLTEVSETVTGSTTWTPGSVFADMQFVIQLFGDRQLFSATAAVPQSIDIDLGGTTNNSATLANYTGPDKLSETLTVAEDPAGVISTATLSGSVTYTYTPLPVPEPATWAMLLVGFAGLSLFGYRGFPRKAPAA